MEDRSDCITELYFHCKKWSPVLECAKYIQYQPRYVPLRTYIPNGWHFLRTVVSLPCQAWKANPQNPKLTHSCQKAVITQHLRRLLHHTRVGKIVFPTIQSSYVASHHVSSCSVTKWSNVCTAAPSLVTKIPIRGKSPRLVKAWSRARLSVLFPIVAEIVQ